MLPGLKCARQIMVLPWGGLQHGSPHLLPPLPDALLLEVQGVRQAGQAVQPHHQRGGRHRSDPRRLPLQLGLGLQPRLLTLVPTLGPSSQRLARVQS